MAVFYITLISHPPAEAKCTMINGSDPRCLDTGNMTSIDQQDHRQSDLIISSRIDYSPLLLMGAIIAVPVGVVAAIWASRRSGNKVI